MKRLLVAVAAVAVLLSGCAQPSTLPDSDGVDAVVASLDDGEQLVEPSELVGTWRVSDAEGTSSDTWLRLSVGLQLHNECGGSFGEWDARDDAFLADVIPAYPDGCTDSTDWLTNAVGYGFVDGDLALLGGDGERLATLTDDGTVPDEATWLPNTDFDLSQIGLTDHAPLPSEAQPVEDLVGKWVAVDDPHNTSPFLEFAADGGWNGNDCNSMSGRWVLGENGGILVTGGITTLVACVPEQPAVIGWLTGATTVGLVGDELTLYDTDGAALGALVRA